MCSLEVPYLEHVILSDLSQMEAPKLRPFLGEPPALHQCAGLAIRSFVCPLMERDKGEGVVPTHHPFCQIPLQEAVNPQSLHTFPQDVNDEDEASIPFRLVDAEDNL